MLLKRKILLRKMNTKILQKCVDEMKKDTFSKEYVLGMLETLIEMQETVVLPHPFNHTGVRGEQYTTPAPDPVIADLVNPVITGFKDLIPKEEINDTTKELESNYLNGRIGKV